MKKIIYLISFILLISIIFNISQYKKIAELEDNTNGHNKYLFDSHVAELLSFKCFKVSEDNDENYNKAINYLLDLQKSAILYKVRDHYDIEVSMFYSRCINHYTNILKDIRTYKKPEDMNKIINIIQDIIILADWLENIREDGRLSYGYDELTSNFEDKWTELNKLMDY